MRKLPRVAGRKVIRALEKAGFAQVRVTGDHAFLVNRRSGRRTVVPMSADPVPVGTLASILRQAGLTVDEFVGLVK